jgi:hypothetical protein
MKRKYNLIQKVKIILPIIYQFIPGIILLGLISAFLIWLPHKNIVSVSTAILIPTYIYYITLRNFKVWDWITTTLSVALLVIFTFITNGYGLIGFILFIVGIVAYRLYKGWKLYKYTIKWATGVLKYGWKPFDTKKIKKE